MQWFGRRESDNVEDGRGSGGGTGFVFGGGIGAVVIGIIVYLLGGDPSQILQPQGTSQPQSAEERLSEDSSAHFARVVLADTEDVWDSLFHAMGKDYIKPKMRLFNDAVESGCGQAGKSTGPFYCPADSKVYLDLSFFKEMRDRFQAPGDFAEAYVIAHEVGHHVQNLLGNIPDKSRYQDNEKEMNHISVMIELQADFYAGVWAHYEQSMKNVLDPGDIEEALNAANAIGDDRLQKKYQGYIVPDAFTHGTSQQRMYWFKKGYESGDIRQGDTFKATASL